MIQLLYITSEELKYKTCLSYLTLLVFPPQSHVCSNVVLMPLVRNCNADSHENKRKDIHSQGVSKPLTGCVEKLKVQKVIQSTMFVTVSGRRAAKAVGESKLDSNKKQS